MKGKLKKRKEFIEKIREETDEEKLTSEKAYRLMERRPTIELFGKLMVEMSRSDYIFKNLLANYIIKHHCERIIESIKKIHDYLHKINRPKKKELIIALATMFHTGLICKYIPNYFGVSEVGIRNLNRLLNEPIILANQMGLICHILNHDPDLFRNWDGKETLKRELENGITHTRMRQEYGIAMRQAEKIVRLMEKH